MTSLWPLLLSPYLLLLLLRFFIYFSLSHMDDFMGLWADATMFSFRCYPFGRDDKVRGGCGHLPTSSVRATPHPIAPDHPHWSFHPTFRSIDQRSWVFGSVGSKNSRASENSWQVTGSTPGSGAHLDHSQGRECPQPPTGLGQGWRATDIEGRGTANTPLHGLHPWWIKMGKWENTDISYYTSSLP